MQVGSLKLTGPSGCRCFPGDFTGDFTGDFLGDIVSL